MRLPAWRETFMWLAVSACGHRASPPPGSPPNANDSAPPHERVSVFDAPPLAGASYVATVSRGGYPDPGPDVGVERGAFKCGQLVRLTSDQYRGVSAEVRTTAAKTCDPTIAALLAKPAGVVFVIDAGGPHWLSAADVLRAVAPIDTPAKALLLAWIANYQLAWKDGDVYRGNHEDGYVKAVAGGYEIQAIATSSERSCGGPNAKETVTDHQLTLFVDVQGTVSVRKTVKVDSYDVADPCHPHGRRPADFVALASGGTARGLLRRAMHDEAESVRAFERIARELHAHGAPDELIAASEQAAIDERDHAARCAALIGETAVIASDALPVRGLLELAIDNAREGCVGESYAALAAVVQARTAESAELRAHFAAIATDEIAHAALAHAIADWIDGELSPRDRALVAAARAAATRELAGSLDAPASPAMRALGMPAGDEARRLLASLAL